MRARPKETVRPSRPESPGGRARCGSSRHLHSRPAGDLADPAFLDEVTGGHGRGRGRHCPRPLPAISSRRNDLNITLLSWGNTGATQPTDGRRCTVVRTLRARFVSALPNPGRNSMRLLSIPMSKVRILHGPCKKAPRTGLFVSRPSRRETEGAAQRVTAILLQDGLSIRERWEAVPP
jgi:hypothetical protein